MSKKIMGICLLVLSIVGGSVFAAGRGAFPNIGVGARSLAMGGAFVAIADNPDALYWNPAGVNQLINREVSSMHTELFGMPISYNWLGVVQPVGNTTLGFGYSGLDAGQAFGDFPYKEESYLLTYSGVNYLAGQRIAWGVSGKFNSLKGGSELVNSSQQGLGLDLGLIWQKRPFSVGVVVRDFATKLKGTLVEDGHKEAIETKLTPDLAVGFAYRKGNTTWAVDVSELTVDPALHLGVEYFVNGAVSVRAGYSDGSFTGGLGVTAGNWVVDYAYNTHRAGDAQRFSLGLRF